MGADIVVMVHPDYQYDPKLLPSFIDPLQREEADVVLGSRLLVRNPVRQECLGGSIAGTAFSLA